MMLTQHQVQHLLLRAGFGDSFSVVQEFIGKEPGAILEDQWNKKRSRVQVDSNFENPYGGEDRMSKQSIQKLLEMGKKETVKLNVNWLQKMVQSPSGFQDKLAFFWHDHFACRSLNPNFMQHYLDCIRENALGNFGEMLRAVSKSPAMLQYLNNQQNRKRSPNENFAREVMELFTLGRDVGYSEKDISEAARAFTGWGFNREGEFVFRPFFHDEGEKTVLGKSGNLDGDDVIDILLKDKKTAQYISKKWVQFFMSYAGLPDLEKKIADEFYRSEYDIKAGLEVLFTSEEFFKQKYIGRRIKSPIELIVSMQRQLAFRITDLKSLVYLQRMLGQTLFDPPNVAGWVDGPEWVDSATLMLRLSLPNLIFRSAVIENQPGASFDDNDQFRVNGLIKTLETEMEVGELTEAFEGASDNEIKEFLIQDPESGANTQGNDLLDKIVSLTSKPEYQVC